MKAFTIVCVILIVVLVLISDISTSAVGLANRTLLSRRSSNKAFRRICKQRVRDSCTSSSESCGRYGRSRAYICQLFKNDCQRLLTNCEGLNKYRRVARNLCTGFSTGRPSACGSGLSPSTNSSSTLPVPRLLGTRNSNARLRRIRSTRSSSRSTPSSRCVIYTRNCSVNSNVCGRWSLTNQCHRFKNRCLLERANCRTSVSSWNVVNFGNCSSISVNRTGTCASTFSSSSSSSSSSSTSSSTSSAPWANILSSILGTTYPSSSTSNVRPIIIRTG